MKNLIALITAAAWIGSCGPGIPKDSLDAVVALETQTKVYQELRQAMKLAGQRAIQKYPQTGLEGGGAEEFRAYQDSLRKAYWSDVLDTNGVADQYGDSIWTKGTALKWRLDGGDGVRENKSSKGSSQQGNTDSSDRNAKSQPDQGGQSSKDEVNRLEAKQKWLEEQKAKKAAEAAEQQ
ncbi:MAG: hypothetical protein O3B70_02465 [Bacteroidetes bacterium]|nr:hypothetical protein [Bacteroidota bacterium]MDA0903174.1 hypothetical protein [Bacteroidota bacterium]MDA1242421.1 hypothetical protein [Bacteroidota bacterium]